MRNGKAILKLTTQMCSDATGGPNAATQTCLSRKSFVC